MVSRGGSPPLPLMMTTTPARGRTPGIPRWPRRRGARGHRQVPRSNQLELTARVDDDVVVVSDGHQRPSEARETQEFLDLARNSCACIM
eukprot:COSAG01_NODE_677_length_14312_cov_10.195314_6_plen_89_part_00